MRLIDLLQVKLEQIETIERSAGEVVTARAKRTGRHIFISHETDSDKAVLWEENRGYSLESWDGFLKWLINL